MVVLALVTSGCSFLTVTPAPPRPWATRPACTAETPAIKHDFLGAAAAAVAGLTLVVVGAATDDSEGNTIEGTGHLNGTIMVGAVFLIAGTAGFVQSGLLGMRRTRACRAAQADFDRGAR